MRLAASILLAVGLLTGATLATTLDSRIGPDTLNPEWGAIFPVELARSQRVLDASDAGAWTPTERDILALEPLLSVELSRVFKREVRSRLKVRDYYRQYVGMTKNGQRVILVNGFNRGLVEDAVNGRPATPCTMYGPESEKPIERMCPAVAGKPKDFWKREWVTVFDGGCGFFDALYVVAAAKFEFVACHGEA